MRRSGGFPQLPLNFGPESCACQETHVWHAAGECTASASGQPGSTCELCRVVNHVESDPREFAEFTASRQTGWRAHAEGIERIGRELAFSNPRESCDTLTDAAREWERAGDPEHAAEVWLSAERVYARRLATPNLKRAFGQFEDATRGLSAVAKLRLLDIQREKEGRSRSGSLAARKEDHSSPWYWRRLHRDDTAG